MNMHCLLAHGCGLIRFRAWIVTGLGGCAIDPITKSPDKDLDSLDTSGDWTKFTSNSKDLVHWILSMLFGIIYSVLTRQRHAGH